MDNKLAALINLAKHMPEKCLDQAIETLEKMKEEAEHALFSRVYRCSDFLTDDLYKTMRRSGFKTIAATQTEGLLAL